jgi:hypothetical protein
LNYKKLVIPVLLSSVFLITGCTNKEDDKIKPEVAVTTDEVSDVDTIVESEPVISENNENDAVTVVNNYFEGINEEDIEKIKSVYDNETVLESYNELFETLDIKAEVISYEVLSQSGTVWEFDFKVKFSSIEENADYTDNITTYLIKVDSATKKITYLELIATNEV